MMQHNQNIEKNAKIHAAEVRARLFSAKPKPKLIQLVAEPPQPKFVQNFSDVISMPISRQPYWARVHTTFNNHVIDYRQMQWNLETDDEELFFFKRSMKEITLSVLEDFPGVTLADIRGPSKKRHLIYPRHLSMYRIRQERPDLSLPVIGQYFGGRDHTTCLYSIGKIEKMVKDGKI